MKSSAVGRGMSDADVHQLIDFTWARNPLDNPRVEVLACRTRLRPLDMLSVPVLQHYFLDVYRTIMALPNALVIAPS